MEEEEAEEEQRSVMFTTSRADGPSWARRLAVCMEAECEMSEGLKIGPIG